MWEKGAGLPRGWRGGPWVADRQGCDAGQVFRDGVRAMVKRRAVEPVELGPQHAAAQGAQCIALHAPRQSVQEAGHGRRAAEGGGVFRPELVAEIGLVPGADLLPDRALVEPGPRLPGWGKELLLIRSLNASVSRWSTRPK